MPRTAYSYADGKRRSDRRESCATPGGVSEAHVANATQTTTPQLAACATLRREPRELHEEHVVRPRERVQFVLVIEYVLQQLSFDRSPSGFDRSVLSRMCHVVFVGQQILGRVLE